AGGPRHRAARRGRRLLLPRGRPAAAALGRDVGLDRPARRAHHAVRRLPAADPPARRGRVHSVGPRLTAPPGGRLMALRCIMITYEQMLNRDVHWALEEGSLHFENESSVHKTLRKITRRLDELGIPYAVVGAMAMFLHGFRRFTEDVDLLVTPEGLAEVHRQLEGRGYLPPFQGSKQLRDAEYGVRIEFLVTGAYPGDGKPKPVAFPDPAASGVVVGGVRCLQLPKLIELKLASGTTPGRRKDLADVQELIRVLNLPADFANQLDPSVQDLYKELWSELQAVPP